MEGQARDVESGDSLTQKESQLDKTAKKSLSSTGCNVGSLFTFIKRLHVGKVISQQQHDSEITKPSEGHIESNDLVNGSEGIEFNFCDKIIDADFSNYLIRLLHCRKICPGKVNESEANAYETLISQRINQDGRGTMPHILILSKELADASGSTSKQSLEKVKLTEHTIHLQVYTDDTFTEEVAKEIAEMFQLHYNEGIQVVYPLKQRFYATTIKGEKPIKTGVRGDTIWEPQHQLKIIESVGRYFKAKEDLVKGMHLKQIPSKKIKY